MCDYYTLRGIINYKKENYEETLQTLHTADSLGNILGGKHRLFTIYRFQGKTHYDNSMFPEAIVAFEKIKLLQKEIKFDDLEFQEVLSLLGNSYEKIHEKEKALENYTLVYEIYKTNNTLKERLNHKVHKEYDMKKLQKKIQSLRSEKVSKEKTK